MTERDIFIAALQIADQSERTAYLDKVCGDDQGLRGRIEQLLLTNDQADSFLQSPVPELPATISMPQETVGQMIGPYRLLQQIGEGGMGIVFMAEQTQPVQRKIALKIIKPGMDNRQVIARFEAERQALAVMDHVNIARVIDRGTTESGRPYFVMELINGIPITKYCDDNHLTPRERLELFIPVCQAVQHAHQKGIIHRDIKPSNVLITLYDGKPVPKVIDFGVAKAIDQKLTDNTLFTNFGTMVGTLEYMSPEQAEINNLGVDTRSDIYSLGVLLYELLTGSTPLTRKRLKEAANFEILRLIKEEEPQKPSTRLSESGDKLASISAQRKMEPAKLSKLVRGELDWIVMKTLEKDRNRRYETAIGLAVDVQRYLADEPVQACPPSAGYRVKKFVRRNRGAVLATGAVAAALLAGTAVSLWQANLAWESEQQAKKNEEYARQSFGEMQAFVDFVSADILSLARPKGRQGGLGIDVSVAQALEAAEAKLAERFAGHPTAEAVARNELGKTWRILAKYPRAEVHLRKALQIREQFIGVDDDTTIDSRNSLGVLLTEMGKYRESIALHEQNLWLRRQRLGLDHKDTLQTVFVLTTAYSADRKHDQVLQLCQEWLGRMKAVLGEEHEITLGTMDNLAVAYHSAGQIALALPLMEKVYKARAAKEPEEPDTLTSLQSLAEAYSEAQNFEKAIPLFKEALEKHKRFVGPDHPDTLQVMYNYAGALVELKEFAEAEVLLSEALAGARRKLPADHPATLSYLSNLAHLFWKKQQYQDSIRLYEDALELAKRVHGVADAETVKTAFNLAINYRDGNQFDKAEKVLDEWLPRGRAVYPFEDHHYQTALEFAGNVYQKVGRSDKAESVHRQIVDYWKKEAGPKSIRYADELFILACHVRHQNKLTKAEAIFSESLAIREEVQPEHWTTYNVKCLIGACLFQQQKYEAAEPLLLAAYEGMNRCKETIPVAERHFFDQCTAYVVMLYIKWGKMDQADAWRQKLPEEMRQKLTPKPAQPAETKKN